MIRITLLAMSTTSRFAVDRKRLSNPSWFDVVTGLPR